MNHKLHDLELGNTSKNGLCDYSLRWRIALEKAKSVIINDKPINVISRVLLHA